MVQKSVVPSRWRALDGLLPFLLSAWFLWTSTRATTAQHSTFAWLALGGLYFLFSLALTLAARFAVHAGRGWGVAGALGFALAPAVQWRIDGDGLQHPLVFTGFVLLVGGLAFACLERARPRAARLSPRGLLAAYGAFLAWGAATFGAAQSSQELRWHLYKHHRLFGTPLYVLGSRALADERDLLWTRRGRLAQPDEHLEAQGTPAASFERPPHVIFVLLDTLRADALAGLGGPANVMPAMNDWAERSTLFTDLHTNASWTRASCASIFTGLLPEEHGAARFHERLSEAWTTLPERMQELGYQTAAFIANWVQVGRETGFAQGFEAADFHELASGDEILAQAGEDAPEVEVRGAYARAEVVNRSALEWLASPARDPYKPLFLYLHYLDPHSPYLEPPEPGTLSDPKQRKHGLYRQQLRYLDRQLADLFRALDEELGGPKIVVLTSDHGEEFYEHDEWGHGHALYRELVWVPLVIHRPDGLGARVTAPLESRDLYDLVQALALEPELDLTTWGAARARDVRYASQYLDRAVDARADQRWTGLRRVDGFGGTLIWSAFGPTLEFYDSARDPGELDNRIDRDGARADELRAALEHSVRFWSAPLRVERSARELGFLRALGYAGGVDEP